MSKLIQQYKFSVAEDERPLLIWLENVNCKISIDALSSFPWEGVGFEFYVRHKDSNSFIKLTKDEMFNKLKINKIESDLFVMKYDELEYSSDSEFSVYQKSLMFTNDYLLKFYWPLLENRIEEVCDFNISLSEYKKFKDDVLIYMNALIETFDLNVYEDESTGWDIWLENNKCKVLLSVLNSFPNIGIYTTFYLKDGDTFCKISLWDLFHKYEVNEREYYAYMNCLYETIVTPGESFIRDYRQALVLHSKIILKYYMSVVLNDNRNI